MAQADGRDDTIVERTERLLQHRLDVDAVRQPEIAIGGHQILPVIHPVSRPHLPAMTGELGVGRYRRRFAVGEFGGREIFPARPALFAAGRAHLVPVGAAEKNRDDLVPADHVHHRIAAPRSGVHLEVGRGHHQLQQRTFRGLRDP